MSTRGMNDLLVFLSQRKAAGDNTRATHTGMYFPLMGSWHISGKDEHVFWELYNELYNDAVRNKRRLGIGITEVQQEVSPLLIDIDFKYSNKKGYDRKYTNNDVVQLIKLYAQNIHKYANTAPLVAHVFEKQEPRSVDAEFVKDGFHIMFKDAVLPKETRKRIHKDVKRESASALQPMMLKLGLNDRTPFIDECAITNNWLLYGSLKKDDPFAYQLTYVYSEENGSYVPADLVTDASLFSVRGHADRVCEINEIAASSEDATKSDQQVQHQPQTPVSDTCVQSIQRMLGMLDPSRVEQEPEWIRVGWCLHNISSDREYLDAWIRWSQQSVKFKEGECEKQWNRFRNDGYKLPSLRNWARQDSPEQYEAFVKENARVFLEYSINCGAHYDIATILYSKYSDVFRSVNPKKSDEWYFYDKHRWVEMPGGYILMNKMSKDLSNDFLEMANFHKRAMISHDPIVVKEHKEKKDKCLRLEYQVKDNGFKTGVLKECARMFFDSEFKDRLDSKPHLICFTNGVFDIDALDFRDGQPDDYVSKSTGISYDREYSVHHPVVREIFEFVSKVQPIEEMRNYVLTVLATYLGGSTQEQTFQIWTGSGSNGKSTIIELFEKTLGDDYCGKFPVTLLTKDRASSNACTPELQDVMRKRFASMQEPNDNDVIHTGAMKEYTGGDKIYSRGLFSTPTPFKPQFKLVLLCNKMPQIKGTDNGTWRRIRVVNFNSSFVESPSPENEHEYLKDKTLSDKFENWREAFMWLLIEYLKKYKRHGMQDPSFVTKASMEYKKKSDTFMQFMDDNFVSTHNDADRTSPQEVFEAFKMWWRSCQNSQVPSKTDLMDYLNGNTKLKKVGKYFVGVRSKNTEELNT